MILSSKDLDTNCFASLISSEDYDESRVSEDDSDPIDLLTPSDKGIFRERQPVKFSIKAKEMYWQSIAYGRGNRGCRTKGGRG